MDDDLQNYMIQLQLVEALLVKAPDNPELLRLQNAWKDIIESKQSSLESQEQATSSINHFFGVNGSTKWSEEICDFTIEKISENLRTKVVLDENSTSNQIKELKGHSSRKSESSQSNKSRRRNSLEYLMKSEQQRFNESDEDTNKWLLFTKKSNKKLTERGRGSIFASPYTVHGRVGIGTCGAYERETAENSPEENNRKSF